MIEPHVLNAHIARHGPYLVHATSGANVDRILREGLRHDMPTDRWAGVERARPGGVYIGTDEYVSYHMDMTAQLSIDLRCLDVQLIQSDEDHFCDHFGIDRAHRMNSLLAQLGHAPVPIDTEGIRPGRDDWRSRDHNEHTYHRWQTRRSSELGVQINYSPLGDSSILVYTPDENTHLLSTGAWAQEYSWALDDPIASAISLDLGSIRYAGVIEPTAIQLIQAQAA